MRSVSMEAHEEDLRSLLKSSRGQFYGQAILNAVQSGEVVTIHRHDGTTVTLTEVHMAKVSQRY
jgi:hypothetical protein